MLLAQGETFWCFTPLWTDISSVDSGRTIGSTVRPVRGLREGYLLFLRAHLALIVFTLSRDGLCKIFTLRARSGVHDN